AFITRLGPAGNLAYSTYLGGSANDAGSGIALDSGGNVYLAGIATSQNFPTANPLQASLSGASDLYIAKLNASGNQLVYSTYLGGSSDDAATSLAVDPPGNVYVTGATLSSDFRTASPAQTAHAGGIFDGFVAKLNPTGNRLVYSTYLGGGQSDRCMRIAADLAGNAYVTGDTRSTNFPAVGAQQRTPGGSSDAFVAKLNPNGSLDYSTYLGGSGIDGGTAIAVGPNGSAYVTGFTDSTNFPTVGPVQPANAGGSFDAFVAKLDTSGSALTYSTYLGGAGTDSGFGVAVDSTGSAFVMGLTDSTDFPAAGAFQPANRGGVSDLFITKLRSGPSINSARVKGKKLIVTGSEFDAGARILVDGLSQKTANDAENPSSVLVAKKAGRSIGPGQRVILQVRNSDGGLSPEFSFMRPAQ
ncbi:MAG TPA: SBBP repeat-containing protein, partial [Blastocatellia bacterium]|nr:SBBP repeat-containing protein [Blastocatellia bacterium]